MPEVLQQALRLANSRRQAKGLSLSQACCASEKGWAWLCLHLGQVSTQSSAICKIDKTWEHAADMHLWMIKLWLDPPPLERQMGSLNFVAHRACHASLYCLLQARLHG